MTLFTWTLKVTSFTGFLSSIALLFGAGFAAISPGGWPAWRVALLAFLITWLVLLCAGAFWAMMETPWRRRR